MAQAFAAERPAAQHCAELIARGPRPEERAAAVTAWRRDLAAALGEDLAPLLSGDRLGVSLSEPEALDGAAALARIGPVAANSLLRCGESGETVLFTLDFADALALTERSFGGEGRVAETAQEQLPRSAALLVEEAAAVVARALTRVSGGAGDRGEVIVRSDNAARLKPFDPAEACLLFTLSITNQVGNEWRARLALSAARLERLLPDGASPARGGPRAPASPLAAPFSAVPLPLRAVLAEIDLPLVRLAALRAGDTIPLPMGRQVPLMIGEQVLAHGLIGTAGDRMAIRLFHTPAEGVPA